MNCLKCAYLLVVHNEGQIAQSVDEVDIMPLVVDDMNGHVHLQMTSRNVSYERQGVLPHLGNQTIHIGINLIQRFLN